MWQKSYDGSPTLYLVPTPIGNMEDITMRAINILKNVDVVFSEDTRVTLQLFNHFKIRNKLIHLDDHNEENTKIKVLEYLRNNKSAAIVTDRGMPIISDPGYKTVKFLRDEGYNVVALPGASALLPAVVASTISSEHFLFYGFLSSKEKKVYDELNELKDLRYTMIFYEAPHRIMKTLNYMLDVFGDRYISISREISKMHESIFVGNINDAINSLVDIKGEFVIVVSGSNSEVDMNLSVVDMVNLYIKSGLSSMEAIKKVAKERKMQKNDVYMQFHGGEKK